VPSIPSLAESLIGVKNLGRAVSKSVNRTCRPPASISGIVPAMNHVCAAPEVTAEDQLSESVSPPSACTIR
jgi:hypothetical protein